MQKASGWSFAGEGQNDHLRRIQRNSGRFENNCEDEENKSKPYVLHAEANAITKVAKSNNSSDGATLYVTSSPCLECAKLIIQAGIKRVIFADNYRLEDGINLLKRANIEVVQVDLDE